MRSNFDCWNTYLYRFVFVLYILLMFIKFSTFVSVIFFSLTNLLILQVIFSNQYSSVTNHFVTLYSTWNQSNLHNPYIMVKLLQDLLLCSSKARCLYLLITLSFLTIDMLLIIFEPSFLYTVFEKRLCKLLSQ